MAGHSQFKNIMYRKGAQDKKRGKLFNKMAREITVAAKAGTPDLDGNPSLRAVVQKARKENMPKDRIDRAIKNAAPGGDDTIYEEMRYEGFGPGGIAFIVEALTDNRNRTAAEVRSAFTKYGGHLGETGSVSFMFSHVGSLTYSSDQTNFDSLFMAASEVGAEDVEEIADGFEVITSQEAFGGVRDMLEKDIAPAQSSNLIWRPTNKIPPSSEEAALSLFKMMDVLEDNDDVQNIYLNAEISEALAASIVEQLG